MSRRLCEPVCTPLAPLGLCGWRGAGSLGLRPVRALPAVADPAPSAGLLGRLQGVSSGRSIGAQPTENTPVPRGSPGRCCWSPGASGLPCNGSGNKEAQAQDGGHPVCLAPAPVGSPWRGRSFPSWPGTEGWPSPRASPRPVTPPGPHQRVPPLSAQRAEAWLRGGAGGPQPESTCLPRGEGESESGGFRIGRGVKACDTHSLLKTRPSPSWRPGHPASASSPVRKDSPPPGSRTV